MNDRGNVSERETTKVPKGAGSVNDGNSANASGSDAAAKRATGELDAAGLGSVSGPSGRPVMRDAEPPVLPRPRMPLSQRAKIFIPFDPLKGYQEALREKECEAEARMNEIVRIDDPA